MYSHQDKDRSATAVFLIATVPFAILTAITIIMAVQAAF